MTTRTHHFRAEQERRTRGLPRGSAGASPSRNCARLPRGFTLLEIVVTMAILSILMVGLGSAVFLARRAVPDGKSGVSAALTSGRAAETLAADLFYATSVVTTSPTEIVFMVADRNGDSSPETIRYYWSGTPGDPLWRQYGAALPASVAEDVREFQLAYYHRSAPLSGNYSEGSETLLASYDNTSNTTGVQVDSYNWCGQYFVPALPAGASSWKVTRVRLRLRSSGSATEETRVQLRVPRGVFPSATILQEVSLLESTLPSGYQWKDIFFNNVSGLAPGTGLCLVLKGLSSAASCELRKNWYATPGPNRYYLASNSGGAFWSASASQSLRFFVYGTVSTSGPVHDQYLLTGVRCTLRSGGDALSRIQTTIRVVNEPPMSSP